jgi:hypothetical protein
MDELINLSILNERAKELECLYLIDEALTRDSITDILIEISKVTPKGFCKYDKCNVVVVLDDKEYAVQPITEHSDEIKSDIIVDGRVRGYIKATYPAGSFSENETVFLPQEQKLLNAIATKVSHALYKKYYQEYADNRSSWKTIIELLQDTDQAMLRHICEKMIAMLAKTNQKLVEDILIELKWYGDYQGEINYPQEILPDVEIIELSKKLFNIARSCFYDDQIYNFISLWIYQGKTYELIKVVNNKGSDVRVISKALCQYIKAIKSNKVRSKSTERWLLDELIRRFMTDNPMLIEYASKYITVEDFCELLNNFICSPNSSGKIGGKATGFFIANQILKANIDSEPLLKNIKVPKTWYISSDELDNLLYENGLDELHEHKYHDILEIRIYYPKIIQTLKAAGFSSYVLNQLNRILDETENKPLIIRSSSILEDQIDSAFSGKYKSLFITNYGSKSVRLQSLVEGILEVYASMYNPDSIQYRKERNLLDCKEQMAIMIQEVVGCRVGRYYFPLYAGVAFSNNELRWSPRIKREDGLIRMVMGLGTRAVDRIGDDFPVLISPGQPKLTVNQAPGELRRYSPRMLDAIDLESNRFKTISITELIKEYGNEMPNLNHIVSILRNDFLIEYNKFTADHEKDEFIVTFEGLINKTAVISEIKAILALLQDKLGYAVDIEFASDGTGFYLLQCRSQSVCHDSRPAAIPTGITLQNTVFTAGRYISNGKVLGIKTVVYIDPAEYSELDSHQEMVNVANVVSELNRILPRRSFILMGPGRWGSRGDIKLGVQVTYSDINNTAMLIEIAHTKSRHQPELSFGTHFFQDLVEANIKYLPLYPEDDKNIFNKAFFNNSRNELAQILPDYAHLSKVVKIINIEKNFYGKELNILMNADLEKAIAYLEIVSKAGDNPYDESMEDEADITDDQGWKWRHYMAERIAEQLDFDTYGVKGIYLFGSTNTCTARLNSDIDLLLHIDSSPEQRKKLDLWLNGWSKALAEMNYLKTGYKSTGLLDVHYVTDKDIAEKNSYAVKINSIYDPASPLRVK